MNWEELLSLRRQGDKNKNVWSRRSPFTKAKRGTDGCRRRASEQCAGLWNEDATAGALQRSPARGETRKRRTCGPDNRRGALKLKRQLHFLRAFDLFDPFVHG